MVSRLPAEKLISGNQFHRESGAPSGNAKPGAKDASLSFSYYKAGSASASFTATRDGSYELNFGVGGQREFQF